MKHISILTLFLAVTGPLCAQSKNGTFTGELMDKQCAQMSSHENMMKSEGAKDAKECTLACVKNGGSFALLDPQTKKVYPIADEKKVREYAGERVQISGNYDQDSDVLDVKNITRAH
jgi:uncharacterized protein YdeI (BOF family)